jgi:uncharacterized glyoxalase superfamily protein PhnB
MAVQPVPEGFHTVTPYLVVDGAAPLIDFLKQGFGAEETHRSKRPDGTIMHAQVRIGDSMVMLADATKEHPAAPCSLYLYVKDVDALYARAMKAGATSIMKPENMFYGDRNGGVMGPGGVQWWIGTHVEDLSEAEIEKRAAAQKPRGG